MFYELLGIDPLKLSTDARRLVREANTYRRTRREELHTDHFVAAAVALGFVDGFPIGISLSEIEKRTQWPIDDKMSAVELLEIRRSFRKALLYSDGSQITPVDIISAIKGEVHSRGATLLNSQYPWV